MVQPEIVAAAQAAQRATGVPASVSIAQYGLESGWGRHMPPGSNNPFGIKAFHGGGVEARTAEVADGRAVTETQPFAVFASVAEAFAAHARLIATDRRYAPAMAALPDIGRFVRAMAAHYATDPAYAGKVLAIIAGDDLARYDTESAA